jgi:hypothetical protein
MAKAVTKKAKVKSPKGKPTEDLSLDQAQLAPPVAPAPETEPVPAPAPAPRPVAAPVDEDAPLQPPTRPIEASVPPHPPADPQNFGRRGERDKIANSLNIAKLQGMQMTDLNRMARELGVENFGTMRKHEVIFHILQKNAERAGVLFSEGVLEVLPDGYGFPALAELQLPLLPGRHIRVTVTDPPV